MTDQPPAHLTRQQQDAFKHARPPARAPLTDKDKVRALWGPIRRKLAAGWSYEEVRQELARAVGFKGTRRTLYNYVWQLSSALANPTSPPSSRGPGRQGSQGGRRSPTAATGRGSRAGALPAPFHPEPGRSPGPRGPPATRRGPAQTAIAGRDFEPTAVSQPRRDGVLPVRAWRFGIVPASNPSRPPGPGQARRACILGGSKRVLRRYRRCCRAWRCRLKRLTLHKIFP